jgi:hypothetical protein
MNDEPTQRPTNFAPPRAAAAQPTSAPGATASTQEPAPAPRPALSTWRFILAMLVAVAADSLGSSFGEVFAVVFDLLVGFLLALCLRGFRPEIIVACLIEAIPGVGLFPSWSLAVPAIWARLKLGANAAASADSSRPR